MLTVPGLMYWLISTLPVSPPPLVASVASISGSVAAVLAPRVTPLTAAVVSSACPPESTSGKNPVTAESVALAAVVGSSLAVPTKAPGGIPVPATERPASVATIEGS